MKYFYTSIIALLIIIFVVLFYSRKESGLDINTGRIEKSFNDDWFFNDAPDTTNNWVKVEIPHIPKIEPLIVNDQWQGTMWYKKNFKPTNENKKYFLRFEGIMHEAEIWINGQMAGKHEGGYLPFVTDITDYLIFHEINEIKLEVNNEDNPAVPPGKPLKGLDFNYYGGIYRNVSLTETNHVYITDPVLENKTASGGILVHFSDVSEQNASGMVKLHVRNENEEKKHIECEALLTDPDGQQYVFKSGKEILDQNDDVNFKLDVSIPHPFLWSTVNPNLYKLEIKIYDGENIVDNRELNIGVRKIELRDSGFYLNNKKLYIRGTNRHQEYPYVGYAISENANYRDAVKIKQAGFDFVRLSHYPQDRSFLDACDELGILVMDAIPGWQFYGDSIFIRNSYRNIRDMVRRDRNHPSVVFWEVSLNESAMTNEYMIEANKILKEELPFDDVYSAGWIDHEAYDLYIPARQHGKPPKYWNDYKNNQRPVFIAEYGDWEYYAQNAGFNQAEFKNLKEEERTSRQLRKHGEKRLLQQALNFQEAANSNRKGLGTIGHANWLMFDYNRGYTDDIEASGISDIFRIPKFAYYFYQSQRSPEDTLTLEKGVGPMVKIASYWTPSSDTRVRVYSNCEEVALFLNDSLIKRSNAEVDQYSDYLQYPPFYFDIKKYKPGTLKAVGFIHDKEVTEDRIATPGKPSAILLEIDESGRQISKNETDIVFVYAKIIDQNGTIIPDSEMEVKFTTTEGELIGQNPIKAEAGIACILLKVKDTGSKITLTASSNTMEAIKAF